MTLQTGGIGRELRPRKTNNDMTNKLKPCPFCGTIPERHVAWHCQSYFYRCPKCEVCVGSEDWTRRPIEDALRAKLQIASAALEKLSGGFTDDYRDEADKALAKLKE